MKILIYGESYWYGVALPLQKAFEKLGHEVDLFDWTGFLFRAKKINLFNRILDRILIVHVIRQINSNFLKAVRKDKADFILVLQGKHLLSQTVQLTKEYCRYIANWHIDDFLNPCVNNSKFLRSSLKYYDCIYSARKHLSCDYYRYGARRVEWLNWFYYPEKQYPLELAENDTLKWGGDIAFIGTWSKYREKMINNLRGFNIKIWGAHWNKAERDFKRNFNVVYKEAWFEEMSKVVNSTKIIIDVLTKENRDAINLKNFQIPACGGFLITERTEQLLELFEEDKDIVCYSTVEELRAKCEYYLEHENERKKIAQNAYAKVVKGNNTLLDRAKQILDTVS